MDTINFLLALCLGLGLSAACGFRIFVPPFAVSLAGMQGVIELSADWQWLANPITAIALGIATTIEVLAYFIPWVSNALDAVELIAAPIAGMLLTASSLSMVGDIDPVLMWTVAAIVGGGTAELVEGTTTLTRLVTASATGGLGNPVVATMELLSAAVLSLLAILAPVFALILVLGLTIFCWRQVRRLWRKRQRTRSAADTSSLDSHS